MGPSGFYAMLFAHPGSGVQDLSAGGLGGLVVQIGTQSAFGFSYKTVPAVVLGYPRGAC